MKDAIYLPNLPQLEWVQTLRDPIWGEIPITEVEKQIIQTEAFYRLRGIKQLGFAYLAFPGAVHSRFEHSLGAMHATDMLLKMVNRDSTGPRLSIESFERQLLRLAALLHDIGHPPFSHAMEKLFTYYPQLLRVDDQNFSKIFNGKPEEKIVEMIARGRHEFFTEWIICNDPEITDVLRHWIKETRGEVLNPEILELDITTTIRQVIAKLAVGQPVEKRYTAEKLFALIRIFKSIMSGDIDADKIDYIRRDNYYCGLPHSLDLASLRNQLIPQRDGLQILPQATRFVHSLILARYRLVTEVHQEKWDSFATSKVIELLYNRLIEEKSLAEKIYQIFIKWHDSNLIDYLFETGDKTIKSVLTTRYPLQELVRLEFIETHPYIRECIQVLSEPANHHQIIELQNDLRRATGRRDLFVQIHSGKSPQFSMDVVGGGNLLRDQILRGISEESIKNLFLVVYGKDNLSVDLKTVASEFLACHNCPLGENCVENLHTPEKKLVAQLAVHRYRKISQACGRTKIIAADYLLLIMEKINKLALQKLIEPPIRQDIYQIARLVFDQLKSEISILGNLDLSQPEITSSFYHELRKYEQIGLIAYSREIRKLKNEEEPYNFVFRYDRRFQLSEFGMLRLKKVRQLRERGINAYDAYISTWNKVETALQHLEAAIIQMLPLNSNKKELL
jgi:HD superfamily phosphohydrolase